MVIFTRMKRRSTTPVSIKGISTRSTVVAAAVLMAIAGPIAMYRPASADQYDTQIQALQGEIDQYQSQASTLGSQARTLQDELHALDNQKAIIQAQIDQSQVKLDQLKQQIIDTQAKINQTKESLGTTLANMYANDSITPLEMLASSNNIGDYVDKQEIRSSVRDQLTQQVDEINKLMAELQQQKLDTDRVLVDQQSSKTALVAKENERNDLLQKTQNDENAYKALVSDRQTKQLQIQQQQQAAIEAAIRAAGGGRGAIIIGGTSGGYPWDSSNCYVDGNAWSWGGADGNGTDGYGYGCRQCVSYVAWRIGKERGYIPVNWGNAYDWVGSAQSAGYTVSREPRAGSAGIITSGGSPGHIVWVESVNSADGTMTVAQYNYFNAGGPGWGNFSRMIVPIGTYQWYVYF